MSENTTQNGVEFKACGCGCGAPIKPKSNYLPGHDARHKGQVARDVAARVQSGESKSVEQAEREGLFVVLPSQALREKAMQMARKIVDKANAETRNIDLDAIREQSPEDAKAVREAGTIYNPSEGAIKIGRWDYPARMNSAGKVERNEKRDGSGAWLPVSANAAQNIEWK